MSYKLCWLVVFIMLFSPGVTWGLGESLEAEAAAREATYILDDLERAERTGDTDRIRGLGLGYAARLEKIERITQRLWVQGRYTEVDSIRQIIRRGALEHQSLFEKVRYELPPKARRGLDIAERYLYQTRFATDGDLRPANVRTWGAPGKMPPQYRSRIQERSY